MSSIMPLFHSFISLHPQLNFSHPMSSEEKYSEEEYNDEVPTFLGFKGNHLNAAVTVMCGVGFLLFGYDQGVMGSLLTLDSFRGTFPKINTQLHPENSTLQGAVIALYEVGCLISALSTMYLGDHFGRLKLIFTGCLIMIIGGALQAGSTNVTFLVIARIFSGLGNGLLTSTVPLYAAECSKAHSRGRLLCIHGSLITLGICISYWVDFAFYFTEKYGEVSWRFPVAFQCVFPLSIIGFIFKLPESPRWLMGKGRVEEARVVFAALYDLPVNHPVVEEQVMEIQESLAIEERAGANKFSVKALLKQGEKKNFQRVNLAGWSQVMQQICGINLITYYAGTIYETNIGMSPFNSRVLAACNGTEYFLASLIPIFIIEKVGRRPLFLFGTTGQFLTMLFLFVSMEMAEKGHKGAAVGAAVLLFIFNTFFGVSLLSLTWLYPPEISSLEVRAPTTAISTACNWGFNFMVVMITPVCFERIKHHTYLIFAGINFLMIPVFFFLYPETKGRTLEEMDLIFAKTPEWQPWKSVKIAREMPFAHSGLVGDVSKYKPTSEHYEDAILENLSTFSME